MSNPEPQQPSRPPQGGNATAGWLAIILLALLGVVIFRMSDGVSSPIHNPDAQTKNVMPRGDLDREEQSHILLFREASPAVVHVISVAFARDRVSLNLFEIPRGSGSGFLWDREGHVVTNYHVVQAAMQDPEKSRVRVSLVDNSTWNARFVGADPNKDIAVLKIDAPADKLKPLPIGTSFDLQVGQDVFAIGNPFSLDQTLTTGVISGLGREIQSVTRRPIQDVIQTDAAINPGNSGGPLLDSAGRLIGINTAIYSPSGAYAGIGFAVPVDTVNLIVPQLIRTGRVERPGLGIYIFPDNVVEQLRSRSVLSQKGVLIRDVIENGAAAEAGMQPTRRQPNGEILLGDLIIKVGEEEIIDSPSLFRSLEKHKPGETVSVTVLRDGNQESLQVTLQSISSVE